VNMLWQADPRCKSRRQDKSLVGKRPRHGRVDNIESDLGEIGWGGEDWTGLTQDRDK
jgi:hypothetical protein